MQLRLYNDRVKFVYEGHRVRVKSQEQKERELISRRPYCVVKDMGQSRCNCSDSKSISVIHR